MLVGQGPFDLGTVGRESRQPIKMVKVSNRDIDFHIQQGTRLSLQMDFMQNVCGQYVYFA